mgnify:CR=1 FL=1
MAKHDIETKRIESLEVFKKLAPIARNSVGINTTEPALLSAMLYLLDRIDTNLEKLVEQTAQKAEVKVEEIKNPTEEKIETAPAATPTTKKTTTK